MLLGKKCHFLFCISLRSLGEYEQFILGIIAEIETKFSGVDACTEGYNDTLC